MNELITFLNARLDEDEWLGLHAQHDYAARVLREVAAKRAILRKLITDLIDDHTDETAAWILKTMAEVYRDHPGWREEWAT